MASADLQKALLPAAVGTSAIIYSSIVAMKTMGGVRYGKKEFSHPYKPWADDHNDKEGKHYRGFKACQNSTEWTVYTLPALWMNVLYAPALEAVPVLGPAVAPWLPLAAGGAALAYAWYNVQYVQGYMSSAEGRLGPFKARTACFKFLIFGAFAGIGTSLAAHTGMVAAIQAQLA